MHDSQPGGLAIMLDVPARVRRGAAVPLTLRVANRAGHALDLYLRGRTPVFDVEILGPRGEVIWRRLEGETIPAILHLRTLAPGESFELTASWQQATGPGGPIAPGEYTARAILLGEDDGLTTAPSRFRILGD